MASRKRTSSKDATIATQATSQSSDQHSTLRTSQTHPAAIFHRSKGTLNTLKTDDVLQLQRTIGNRAVQRMIIQRLEVPDLTVKDQEKWYVIQGNVVAKLTGVYNNLWEFRVRDDFMGNAQFVNLTSGRVVPLPHFGTIIDRMYENDDENWFGEFANSLQGETTLLRKKGSGKIKQMDYKGLLELGNQMSKNEVGPNDYDRTHIKVDQGIWTDGMGPCITIALTGIYLGKRINVLHHSFVSHYDTRKYAQIGQDIINELTSKVKEVIGAPLTALKEQEFYIVGGDTDTAPKMEALLRTMILQKFNIVNVVDTSTEAPGKSSKALLINADGTVSWSYVKK